MEWLKDWAQVIGAGITLLAVLVALGIGIASIKHTQSIQKKERRERLLNEIIEWALEIQTTSLTMEIPLNTELSTELSIAQINQHREANLLLRYGKTFAKNGYIMVIINEEFKEDLKVEAEEAINVFTAYLFLRGTSFGMQNIKGAFAGLPENSILDKLEKEIKEDPKKLEELREDYGRKLAASLNKLLLKTAKIKARDAS